MSVSKSVIECYKVRASGEWADITVDDVGKSGRIQIASGYGTWGCWWSSCGVPFKQFLIELTNDINYVAVKVGAARWFDHEATMRELRKQVSDHNNEEEKVMMEVELEVLENCTEVKTFICLAYQSNALSKLWDCGPDIHYDILPAFKHFWTTLWPVFVEELKKENTSWCEIPDLT